MNRERWVFFLIATSLLLSIGYFLSPAMAQVSLIGRLFASAMLWVGSTSIIFSLTAFFLDYVEDINP